MLKSIVITGASSGIGKALALHYAARGRVLGLLGRNAARLEYVANACREKGADVRVGAIDISDRKSLAAWLEAFDGAQPLDLLIANAGVMEGSPAPDEVEPADAAYRLMEINVLGVLNSVQPIVPRMMARGRGQIAIMSSLAGLIPLPDAPSYAASKSAVLHYGLSLRALLAPRRIGVSVICPGYIDTPMMRRESGPKPFAITPDKAAAIIGRGLARNKSMIVFPFFFGWLTRMGGLLPDRVRRWFLQWSRFTVAPDD